MGIAFSGKPSPDANNGKVEETNDSRKVLGDSSGAPHRVAETTSEALPKRAAFVTYTHDDDKTRKESTHGDCGDTAVCQSNASELATFANSHNNREASVGSKNFERLLKNFFFRKSRTNKKPEQCTTSLSGHCNNLLTEADVRRMIDEDKRVIVIIYGYVCDVTDFIALHPGGMMSIKSREGTEVGEIFYRIHSRSTIERLNEFTIGRMKSAGTVLPVAAASAPVMKMIPKNAKNSIVLNKEAVTANIMTIKLSSLDSSRFIPGCHVTLLFNRPMEREVLQRHYTPFVWDETSFTIAVRSYFGGMVSHFVYSLKCGDEVWYRGPFLPAWIAEEDERLLMEAENKRHILFVVGGVAVTHAYPIVTHLLNRRFASVTLLVSYRLSDVMLLRSEIAALVNKYGGEDCEEVVMNREEKVKKIRRAFTMHYVITQAEVRPNVLEAGNVHLGRFNSEVARQLEPATTCVLCGPSSFTDSVAKILADCGVCSVKQIHVVM